MTFLIDNDYKTTLASLIANNELDAATIQELKELDINASYFIGITEVKRIERKRKNKKIVCSFVIKRKSFLAEINGKKILIPAQMVQSTDGTGIIFKTRKDKMSIFAM